MNSTEPSTPVFKSKAPRELARATDMLKAADVPFRVDTEHDLKLRRGYRRSYTILVAAEHENLARDTIAGVPTEVILPETELPPSRLDKFMPWVVVIIVVATVLILLYLFVWQFVR